jgi:hypothetical protein
LTIEEVRIAIADACATIPGWRASPYRRDQVSPPEIQVERGPIIYDVAMGREADEFHYTIVAYVQRDSDRAAQVLMQNLCEPSGSGSLKTVLEADESVRALVDYIRVTNASEDKAQTVGLVDYLVVEFEVEIG